MLAPYLGNLTLRLAAGASRLPEAMRLRHAAYCSARQSPDGGFPGRRGASDLYYTSFALRGLAITGCLDETITGRATEFLRRQLDDPLVAIDFLSLFFSAVLLEMTGGMDLFEAAGRNRREAFLERVKTWARPDGGYAKTTTSGPSSTYVTFLVAACKELIDASLEEGPAMVSLVQSRRREDGGFAELSPLAQGGTNPTAAAVGLLRLLNALDEPTRHDAAQFLAARQSAEGGYFAHARSPVPDLLSTFSALVALSDLDALECVDREAATRYVLRLEQPEGGFLGGLWDDQPDIEYTLYGLGSLALLTPEKRE